MAIHYETSGNKSAPAIVFLHGGGISGWMWVRQAAAFSDYYCIIPDLAEHGKSIDGNLFSISNSVEEIAMLIKTLVPGKKVHVVGHSIGAKIIVELLNAFPQFVDHAVIVSALFRPIPLLNWTFNRFSYRMTVAMLKSKSLLHYQVKQFGFPDEEDKRNLEKDFGMLTVDSLDRVYSELYKHLKLPEHLSFAVAPVLVAAGEKEPKAMRESVNDIVKALPNAKGILFRGCRHDIPWKAIDAFNQTVREWITDSPLTAKAIQPSK
jgi:pimeloyl-ACP methyl ester carboxylesterase